MTTEEIKEMPKSWAMVGGDGPQSYTQNSSYQVHILPLVIIIIIIAILKHWHVRQNSFFFFFYLGFFLFNFII
jgi:indole-3-acetate O-methyltransferase